MNTSISERIATYAYEIFGVQYPRASLLVGVVLFAALGAAFFFFLWGFSAKSYRDAHPEGILLERPDSREQESARNSLYEFVNVVARDAYRDASGFTNDVHSRLGAGKGFDSKETIGGLLRHYAQEDFGARFTALSEIVPPAGREVSFPELSRRVERFVCSYEKMMFWTQRAALLIPISPNDTWYRQWDQTDVEFLARLRDITAKRGLDWLRGQVEGCRQQFRLRDTLKAGGA
jgi:hypothetical protein